MRFCILISQVPRETLRRWAASTSEAASTGTADGAPGGASPNHVTASGLEGLSSSSTASDVDPTNEAGTLMFSDSDSDSGEASGSAFSKELHPKEQKLYEGSNFTNAEACLVRVMLFIKLRPTRVCLGQKLSAVSSFLPSLHTPGHYIQVLQASVQFLEGHWCT